MKKNLRAILTVALATCLLAAAVPTVLLPAAAATTTTVYDFNGTDFATPSDSHDTVTYFATAMADPSAAPAGAEGGVYSGTHGDYVGARVDFGYEALDLTKITSVKMRVYVAQYTPSGTPVFRIFSASSGSFQQQTVSVSYDQWVEVEILDALQSNSVTKNSNGTLSEFVFALRTYGTTTVYYDSLIIEGEEGYYVEAPDPVNVTVTPSGLLQASFGTAKSDWRFWIKPHLTTFPDDEKYFGQNIVPTTIYDKDGNVLISTGDGISTTYYIADGYLMPYITGTYTNKTEPNEGDYIVFAKGTYYGKDTPHSITVTDDITVTYTDGAWVYGRVIDEEIPDEIGGTEDGIFDFDGVAFETPNTVNNHVNSTSYFAAEVTDPSAVPSGFAGSVYGYTSSAYVASWVDFDGSIDLSKVTSFRLRMYVPAYTLEAGKNTLMRVFGSSGSYEEVQYTAGYDQWVEVELLDILRSSKIDKNYDGTVERFLFSVRTYGTATVYFDKIIIEGEDYFVPPMAYTDLSLTGLSDSQSGHASGNAAWYFYMNTDAAELTGENWSTIYPATVLINDVATQVELKKVQTQLFMGIPYKTLPSETVYAVITVQAGKYGSTDGNPGVNVLSDFTVYLYDDDLHDTPPETLPTADVTFDGLDEAASRVNGDHWDMYPMPISPAATPGTPWETTWKNVTYEVDGVAYTGDLVRANNSQGLYIHIPGTAVSPAADGVTIVIKAGTYQPSRDVDPAIRITADYTFYVIGGKATANFDFDDPKFTATVTINADRDTYIVEAEADAVTIDGVAVTPGTSYETIGVHTLIYTRWERAYTRKIIIYRIGEVNDADEIDVCDVVLLQRYLAGQATLSEAGMLGADLNNDGNVNGGDMLLLRHKLLLIEGLLALAPADGITAMGPSEQVTELTTDYDPYGLKGDELQNGTEQFHRDPLILRWVANGDFTEYKVHVATEADFSDETVHTTAATEYVLLNLLPSTTYYWKVTADGFETETRRFTTEDTVRTLTVGGVDNARDIGGYATGENTRLKYGMVYRTATLDTITEDGLYQMLTVLGVKTELDVRTPGEGTAGSGSMLGESVNYLNYNGPYYYNTGSGIIAESYQDALRAEIRAFANADNYPIVVHCSVGRDRTGTILFLIEGLCGVSKNDLFMEYELSFLGRIGGNGADVQPLMNEVDKMYNGIQSYAPNGTFADACEAFMLDIGITQSEIDTIRGLMTEVIGGEEPTPDDPSDDFDPEEDETEIF